jgi:hypothetical protein
VLLGRKVDDRVLVEESGRHELKSAGDAGLDRMVLGPWKMMQAEAVPDDEVAVGDRAILRGPHRQPVIASRLVHEFAGGIALDGTVGRHPKLMLNEPAAFS